MTVDLNKLMTISEAAKRVPYSESQLRAWINNGRITATRLGNHIFIHEDDFATFLNSSATQ
jgi:excisionase family DNA binding protein